MRVFKKSGCSAFLGHGQSNFIPFAYSGCFFLFSCKVLYLKFYLAILPLGFFSGIYSERFFFLFLVPLCCFNVSLPYNTTDSTRLLNKLTLVWMRNFDELKIFPSLPNCDIAFPSPFMFKFPSPSLCPHQLLLLLLVCILVR